MKDRLSQEMGMVFSPFRVNCLIYIHILEVVMSHSFWDWHVKILCPAFAFATHIFVIEERQHHVNQWK